MLGAVVVQDPGSSFASNKNAGARVPRLVAELDTGIEPAFSGPGEVDRRRAEHPHPLRVVREPLGEAQPPTVLALCILAEGVLVDRDQGIRNSRRPAYTEPSVIDESTLPEQGRVLRSVEGKVDNRRNDCVLGRKTQRYGAERQTMQEVDRAIQGEILRDDPDDPDDPMRTANAKMAGSCTSWTGVWSSPGCAAAGGSRPSGAGSPAAESATVHRRTQAARPRPGRAGSRPPHPPAAPGRPVDPKDR